MQDDCLARASYEPLAPDDDSVAAGHVAEGDAPARPTNGIADVGEQLRSATNLSTDGMPRECAVQAV